MSSLVMHVDCDANPFVPDDWRIREHEPGGQIKLERRGDGLYIDDHKVELFQSDAQRLEAEFVCAGLGDGWMGGEGLYGELADLPLLNACVLDCLLANNHLIPEEWKGNKRFFFWGTIYEAYEPSVRYLEFARGQWVSGQESVDDEFPSFHCDSDFALGVASKEAL